MRAILIFWQIQPPLLPSDGRVPPFRFPPSASSCFGSLSVAPSFVCLLVRLIAVDVFVAVVPVIVSVDVLVLFSGPNCPTAELFRPLYQ